MRMALAAAAAVSTHSAAWNGCVVAADNSAPQPEQTRMHARALSRACIASVAAWFRMPESVRITVEAPCWLMGEGQWWGLFVPEHHRVRAANKLLLCNLMLSRLIRLTSPEVKSKAAWLYKANSSVSFVRLALA